MRRIRPQTKRALAPIFDFCEEHVLNIEEFLYQQYHEDELSIQDIADKWAVNAITLTQFFRRHKIPRRPAPESAKIGQRRRFERLKKAKQAGYIEPCTRKALAPIFDYCEENGLEPIEFIRAEYWDNQKTLKGISDE